MLEGRGCNPKYYDWGTFHRVLSENIEHDRPCNTCVAKYNCENLECKQFSKWVDKAYKNPKPSGYSEEEIVKKYSVNKRLLYNWRKAGKVSYVKWRNKPIYTNLDEFDKLTYKPKGLLTSKELCELTGITMIRLKWLLQFTSLKAQEKVNNKNYFGYEAVKEVLNYENSRASRDR